MSVAQKRAAQAAVLTVVAGLGLAVGAGPAAADTATTLYVNNTVTTCTDDGPGTQAQPFCKLAAATAVVTAGQTVMVTGTYHERLIITTSGTADSPITFQGNPNSSATFTTGYGGITISGQHDIVVNNFRMSQLTAIGVALTNSSHITLSNVWDQYNKQDYPGFQLSGVTDSLLDHVRAEGNGGTGVVLDATTQRVSIKYSYVSGNGRTTVPKDGIDVAGSANTIVGDRFSGNGGAAVVLQAGADGNVVADNVVDWNLGDGVDNSGASSTAVTSNTVIDNCGAGIRVDGASSGVSVQNNIASLNGESKPSKCDPSRSGSVDIGVYDSAVSTTTVDYNIAYHAVASDPPYAWGTPMASLADFRAASGQGTHDIQTDPHLFGMEPDQNSPAIDSANSAAPGEQSTDFYSHTPEDAWIASNTGTGPTPYVDRGAIEYLIPPYAYLTVTPSAGGSAATGWPVTADASKSVAEGATIASYSFDFGDGTTINQSDPVAHHAYLGTGRHKVTVTAKDANGQTGEASQWVGVGEMYVPDGPVRVLDTRSAVGVDTTTPVAPFGTVTLPVAGSNGVPSTGVSAVVLNVTVTGPSRSGVLTVYPDGQDRPNASSLNWTARETIANLVTVPVVDGKVDFYNASSGTVHVVADLMGYYANVAGALFTGVSPQRYLDTRNGGGAPVAGGDTVTVAAPAGATAVVLNVTVTAGSGSGYLTVYPDGRTQPTASNLNWTAGQTIANLVTVPVVDGQVNLYNGSSGSVHVIADLFGYYVNQYTTGSPYAPFGPTRLLDTRTSGTGAPVAPGGTVSLPIPGTHGLPSNVSAVVLNVTVTGGTTAGFLTAYPDGWTRPTASNLNWTAGQTIPNAVIVPLGTGGAVDFYNAAGGTVHLVVDIVGYFVS